MYDFHHFKFIETFFRLNMWFILKSVSYTLEKTVFSTIVGGIFYVCLFCLAGFSVTQVFCFISTFCLVVLSIFRSVMSKSQIIIVELYISPSNSVHFLFYLFWVKQQTLTSISWTQVAFWALPVVPFIQYGLKIHSRQWCGTIIELT